MAAEPIPVTISIKAVGAEELKKVFASLEGDLKRLAGIANEASAAANRLRDAQAGVAAAAGDNMAGGTENVAQAMQVMAEEAENASANIQAMNQEIAETSSGNLNQVAAAENAVAANASSANENVNQMAQSAASVQADAIESLHESSAELADTLRDTQAASEQAVTGTESLGDCAANAGQDVEELNDDIEGTAPVAHNVADALNEATNAADSFGSEADSTAQRVDNLTKEIGHLNTVAGEIGKLQNFTQPILSFARSATETAGEFEQLGKKIEITSKSVERAGEVFDAAKKMSVSSSFDTKGIAAAAASLEKLGKVSEEYLPAVADLAAGTGKSIEETAASVSQAFSGSAEGYKQLADSYGFSVEQLGKYGAVLDKNGELLVENSQQAQAARDAFMKLAAVDYAGAAQRQADTFQGSMQAAKNSIDNLKAAVGESFVPLAKSAASVVGGLADAIAALPTPITGAVAQLAVLGGGAIAAAAGFVKLRAGVLSVSKAIEALNALREAQAVGQLATGTQAAATGFRGLAAAIGLTATAGGLLLVALAALAAGNYYAEQIELEKERGRALDESTHKAAKLANALREVNAARDGQKGAALVATGVSRDDLENNLEKLEKEKVALNEQLKSDPEFKGMGKIGSYEFMDNFSSRREEEIKRIERELDGLNRRKQKGEDVERDIAATEEGLHITKIRHINEEYKVAIQLGLARYKAEEAREEKLNALRGKLNIGDEQWNKMLLAGQDTAFDSETGMNLSGRLRSVNAQIEETKKALSSLENEEAKKKQNEAIEKQKRIDAQASAQSKALSVSLMEAELRTLEQKKQAGEKVENAILAKRKAIYEAKVRIIKDECQAEIDSGVSRAIAEESASKKIAALNQQRHQDEIRYQQEELRLAQQKQDAEKRAAEQRQREAKARAEELAQNQLEQLQNSTVVDSRAPITKQLEQTKQFIKQYQAALNANKELLASDKARVQAEKNLLGLKEREKELAERLAEIQKQADEQNKSLQEALLEEELQTLEQRKSEGEKVDAEIADKRAAIHQARLEQIDAEKEEQIKAGVEVEKAEEAARLKRAALDEQEKRRKLAELAELKKASESNSPEKARVQTEAEKAQAEYDSIRKKNQAKGTMSLDDVLAEYNAQRTAWKAKIAEPLGEDSAPKSLADSSAAAATSVAGLSDNAKTASESIKALGESSVSASGYAGSAKTQASVTDGDKSASSALLSFSASLTASAGSVVGSFASLGSAATSAAGALQQLAASAMAQGAPTASTPVAMPTPEAMGAVNPSVLGASSLESGGGSTTNTTNNFYMDDTRVAQSVNTDQIARAVQGLQKKEDAWAKMYLGPWR